METGEMDMETWTWRLGHGDMNMETWIWILQRRFEPPPFCMDSCIQLAKLQNGSGNHLFV
jgi:hypothetical protein